MHGYNHGHRSRCWPSGQHYKSDFCHGLSQCPAATASITVLPLVALVAGKAFGAATIPIGTTTTSCLIGAASYFSQNDSSQGWTGYSASNRVTVHPEVGALCSGLSVISGWLGRGVEDGAVQSRPGDSKAGGYLGNRDAGGFEQRPDGFDLFGGEFGWAAAFSTASTRRFQASNGALPNQITFEFGKRREDMKDKLSGRRPWTPSRLLG